MVLTLDATVSHHVLRVTGVAPGEELELFDAQGNVYAARLRSVSSGRAEVEILRLLPPLVLAEPILLAGLLKHSAFDLLVRMATELGVRKLVPVLASRSVARGDRRDRWARIARSAAAQSGAAPPEIAPPSSLADALAALPSGIEIVVCVPGAPMAPPAAGPRAILVGPEGGWTADEVSEAVAVGALPVGLGPRVLRADTAVVAALTSLG